MRPADQRQAFAAVGERMAWVNSHVERSVAGAVALDLSWQVTPITIATRYMVTSARVALMRGTSTVVRWWGFGRTHRLSMRSLKHSVPFGDC